MASHLSLDDQVEAAWRVYRAALADEAARLAAGEAWHSVVRHTSPELGLEPCMTIARVGDELEIEVPSNRRLGAPWRLDRAGLAALRRLGMRAHGGSYRVRLPAARVDQAADVVVRALRTMGVIHPALLRSDFEDGTPDAPDGLGATPVRRRLRPAQLPRDRHHLIRIVTRALAEASGGPIHTDDEGDIVLSTDEGVIVVELAHQSPQIRVAGGLVSDIVNLPAAAERALQLNRDHDAVKFVLSGDTMSAVAALWASPFVVQPLLEAIRAVFEAQRDLAPLLADELLGRTMRDVLEADDADPDAESDISTRPSGRACDLDGADHDCGAVDEVRPEMLVMMHLKADNPGSVRPKDAAEICHHDPALILDLIRWNEQQEIEWRDSRDTAVREGQVEDSRVCEIERAAAERSVRVLRKALRRVVLQRGRSARSESEANPAHD